MGIRISHGKASTIAQFGIEAGKGEQRVREAAESQANARQQAAINAQSAANALRANTDIQKTILNAQARQAAEEFESFMQGESAKRAIAWEQEKMELRNQHDFDMLEQRTDIENQLKMADDQREKTKLQAKFTALDNEVERGGISPEEGAREKLRLELGVAGSQSPLFKKKTESDIFGDLMAERGSVPDIAPEQKNSAKLLQISSSGTTSAEDRADIKKILASGDPVKIKVALDTLEAKRESQTKTFKMREAIKSILPKPSKRPSFDQTFRQSLGSFR